MQKPTETFSTSILLWIVAIGFFMQSLDTTIVNTALPAMANSIHESPFNMQAVIVAYALTMALVTPISGWLADKFGIRYIFLSAILIFSTSSLMCALSSSLKELVIFRITQGLGGAMLMPIGRLAILRLIPKKDYLSALTFVGIPGTIGPLIGPSLGGWFTHYINWHWIFLINIPIGIIGYIFTLLYMPKAQQNITYRFDLKGYLLLSLSILSLTCFLDSLASSYSSTKTLLYLLSSLTSLIIYVIYAQKAPQPIFSLRLFQTHNFKIGIQANLIARLGNQSMPYLIPLFLQIGLGFSAFKTGLMMLPIALSSMFSRHLVKKLISRFNYRTILIANTLLIGLIIISFTTIHTQTPLALIVIQFILFGGFNAIQFTAMNTLTLKDLSNEFASSGNSLFSCVQMLARSLSVTISAALLKIFIQHYPQQQYGLLAFQATLLFIGIIMMSSSLIFRKVMN